MEQQQVESTLNELLALSPMPPPPAAGEIRVHAVAKGGGSWAPFRDPEVDYSQWGRWEAWQFLAFGDLPDGTVGAYPTGDWIAWDRDTGMTMGFTEKAGMTAREQAVTMCNVENGSLCPSQEQLERLAPMSEWPVNALAKPTREVVSIPT